MILMLSIAPGLANSWPGAYKLSNRVFGTPETRDTVTYPVESAWLPTIDMD